MVWDPLLKADPEGPTLIFHAAVRHVFFQFMLLSSLFFRVSLQHTQSEDCQGAESHRAPRAPRPRRRGDRVIPLLTDLAAPAQVWHGPDNPGRATTSAVLWGNNGRAKRVNRMTPLTPFGTRNRNAAITQSAPAAIIW